MVDKTMKKMTKILNPDNANSILSSKPSNRIPSLDGMRGPLCVGVIAINMNLYNTGANTLVGFFLVQSGVTAYLAYGNKKWDDNSRRTFFNKRITRLLPMLIISTCWQIFASCFHIEVKEGEGLLFNVISLLLILTPLCCPSFMYRYMFFALYFLWVGSILNGPGWYVGALVYLSVFFLPKILSRFGDTWSMSPPSWTFLLLWALAEGLQYGLPLLAYYIDNENTHLWYYTTAWIYLAMPPFFRLVTLVFGLQIGRWAEFEVKKQRRNEDWKLKEARTIVPFLSTALIVVFLHGFLESEPHSHTPTPASPLHWVSVHLVHPFNVLAIICGLVMSPDSKISQLLSSKPLLILGDLSYAMYLLHWGVITIYVVLLDRKWVSIHGDPLDDGYFENELYALDFFAVVGITTALAYPVSMWVEPKVRGWVKMKMEGVEGGDKSNQRGQTMPTNKV